VYALTSEAERLFPKAYEPVRDKLLDVLGDQQPKAEAEELLRTTGRYLAKTRTTPTGDLGSRMRIATETLNALGGLAELEEAEESLQIQGQRCPLGALVSDHPQLCQLAEEFLSELAGRPVQEHCVRGETPRCRFVVAKIG